MASGLSFWSLRLNKTETYTRQQRKDRYYLIYTIQDRDKTTQRQEQVRDRPDIEKTGTRLRQDQDKLGGKIGTRKR